jgi:hypothetical protein
MWKTIRVVDVASMLLTGTTTPRGKDWLDETGTMASAPGWLHFGA